MSGAGERTAVQHKLERQIFQDERAIGLDHLAGDPVPPVQALVGNVLMQTSDFLHGFTPALTAPFLSGQRPLQHSQPTEGGLQVFRTIESRSIRESQGVSEAYIHANRRVSRFLYGLSRKIDLQEDEPAGRFADHHDVFEPALGKRPVPAHFDQPHVLDVKPVVLEAGAVAGLVVERVEAGRPPKSRPAPVPLQKLAVGAVQAAQHLLASRHVEQAKAIFAGLVAPISPHARLFRVGDRLAAFVPPPAPIIERPVVEPTGHPPDFGERIPLGFGWIQAIAIGAPHLTSLLGLNVPFYSFFRNMTHCANVIAATPQARQARAKLRLLLAEDLGSKTFELVSQPLRGCGRVAGNKPVHVIGLDFKGFNFCLQFFGCLVKQVLQIFRTIAKQDGTPIFWIPDQVIFQRENTSHISSITLIVQARSVAHLFDVGQTNIRKRRYAASPVA